MGKIGKFEINLDKDSYSANETISGFVSIKVLERFEITDIRLVCVGIGQVSWSEGKNSFNGSQTFIDQQFTLLSKYELDKSRIFLDPCEHELTFPFRIHLPDKLPNSFESDHSYIRYSIRILIEQPWAYSDKSRLLRFDVINTLDLNMMPELRLPFGKCDTQITECGCYWCWRPGPVDIKFNIQKRGFVAGEKIHFTVDIDNKSSETLSDVCVKLKQKAFLRAPSMLVFKNQRVDKITYAPLKCPNKIKPHTNERWHDKLTIPIDCCPTMLNMTDLIDVEYVLHLQMYWFGSADSDLYIPIVIGTVPFDETIITAAAVLKPARNATHSCVNTEV